MSEALPLGWQRRSLSALGEYENGFAFSDRHWSELGLPIVRIAQITGSQGIVDRYPGRLPDTFRIDTGDLIFSWSGTLAVVRWTSGPAWLNQHLFKVKPDASIDESLLFHLLQASVAEMSKRTHGSTMKHIKRGELHEFFVTLPVERDEQRKLAQVLDTLDIAIHETEAIIAKLKSVKRGLLHDLLTRGIAANGELRPPSAEAPHLYKESPLGSIPKEWDFAPLVSKIDFPEGQVDPRQIPYRDWVLIAPDHIESATGRLLSTATAVEQQAISGKYVFQAGDVIYSKIRPYLRKAVLVSNSGLCSADMYPLRPKTGIDSRYLLAVVLGDQFSVFAESVSMRSGFPKINRNEMAEFSIGWPLPEEQSMIAQILSEADSKQRSEEDEFEKLRLLKAGLMDDLLTGRIRVTGMHFANSLDAYENPIAVLEKVCQAAYKADEEATDEIRRELFGEGRLLELVVMKKDSVEVEIRKENVNHHEPHMHITHSGKFDVSISLKDFTKLAGDIDNKTWKRLREKLWPLQKKLLHIWNELNEKDNSIQAKKLISELAL